MDLKRLPRLFGALAALLAVCAAAAPAEAALPGKNGKIAFQRGSPGSIYAVNPDGSGETLLSKEGANSHTPAWAPNGARLSFTSDGDGLDNSYNLFAVNADGSGLTQLTSFYDESPWGASWSPDASAVVFVAAGVIHTVRADGTGLTALAAGGSPAWSPDGSTIAFGDTEGRLTLMRSDGSGQRVLTPSPATEPQWSPDGSRIAFVFTGLHVIDADGTDERQLAATATADMDWSPDGRQIAYSADVGSNRDVYVVNADGSGAARLTNDPAFDAGPAWAPDGTRIAFVSDRDRPHGLTGIYTMAADGTNVTVLAEGHGGPQWQRIPPPGRSDYRNAAHYCKAQREFLGDSAFRQRYGRASGANAHGGCVNG